MLNQEQREAHPLRFSLHLCRLVLPSDGDRQRAYGSCAFPRLAFGCAVSERELFSYQFFSKLSCPSFRFLAQDY